MSDHLTIFNASDFHHQQVRDLAWIVFGQPIMKIVNRPQLLLTDFHWLQALDKNPQPLITHLENKNLRMLGTYFEALWEFLLLEHPDFDLKFKNLQVFSDQSTIGEFDFIYFDKRQNSFCHLEVAVKYYLGVVAESTSVGSPTENPAESSLLSQWIGPGTRDRLDLKYHKLTQRQSHLAFTPAGKQLLADKAITKIKPQISLLGYLFYPLFQSILPPVNTESAHLRGFWVKQSQLDKLESIACQWAIIDKPHWLAPVTLESEKLLNFKQLKIASAARFEQILHPLLLAKYPIDESAEELTSIEFGFLVPDSWPQAR